MTAPSGVRFVDCRGHRRFDLHNAQLNCAQYVYGQYCLTEAALPAKQAGTAHDMNGPPMDETPAPQDRTGTGTPQDLLLSRQLCFALHSTTLALGRVYQKVLAPLGLTYTQYLAMLVLWERGRLSVGDLGAALLLDSGTLTPLLKRLEQAGHVRRARDPRDERRVLVEPTPAGLVLREEATGIPAAIHAACGSSGVALDALQSDLEALRSALTKSGAEAP